MTTVPLTRQRAPSKRSLETVARILDASETVFARGGFDGASLRDIAAEAGVQVGLVHHHGGGKAELFHKTVARRAEALSHARREALAAAKAAGPLDLRAVLTAFLAPYLRLARTGTHWLNYARLVAYVSVDPRWRGICAECFDPTAEVFLDEISTLLPDTPRPVLAAGFIFAVSSMLALVTTQWRVEALGSDTLEADIQLDHLVRYCEAGLRATA
ncbi:TetR/AcrR family transcriptional regulator [Aestuariivita sp.]|uniref:TetR/AcrR family transcriptional regulator n=1 Tax=Aestuariivita sp. TaxID=1872407 RepID=UPI00216DAD48|nr:TetR/AcrR family transcriptional regulator [Aestuariivita sp.]MCE8007698.1 TetR/AcrR family transcriptional regulator [Aestuariivita sp.]